MHTYTIKKNGYAIGQARGISEGVKRIKLELNGLTGVWRSVKGFDGPECRMETDVYNMEVLR